MVKMTRNHPDWGDSWQGVFFSEIFVPVPFKLNTIYVNGSVGDKSFWFIQAGVGVGGSNKAMGRKKPMSKKLAKLASGIPIPPYLIMTGVDFRLYHHMNHSKAGTVNIDAVEEFDFVPDLKTLYGGYQRTTYIDQSSTGELAEFSVGVEVAVQNKGFNLGLEGELRILNSPLGGALLVANGKMTYDSPKKQFNGSFEIKPDLDNEAKAFCLEGDITFHTKNRWYMSAGSKRQPLSIRPLCTGPNYKGWLEMGFKEFELGLGFSAYLEGKSKWFDVKLFKVRPFANFSIDALIESKVAYRPTLNIKKMGIQVDLSAGIGIDYESLLKSGTWRIASVHLSGNAELVLDPKPRRISGSLDGNVEILGIATDFTLDFARELK
jgi:hypothetical protein